MWLKLVLAQGWVYEKTLILLVSNKTGLQKTNYDYPKNASRNICNITQKGIRIGEQQVRSINTSFLKQESLGVLRDEIIYWIAENGIQGIGTK